MILFEVIRKALLAGLGVQAKVKELIDELVKKGELSKTEGSRLIKEWTDKAQKTGEDLSKGIADLIGKTFEKMNIPTREEVERLNRKVQALSTRLKKLEEERGVEGVTEEE